MQSPSPASAKPRRGTAKAALAAGLAATALAVALLWTTAADRDRQSFEASARDAQFAIVNRVETSVALLRGAAGLFAAFDTSVDIAGFERYVERLALREQYPGILGIGFSRRLAPAERAALERQMQVQGSPDFHVWPDGDRPELHSILYLEPLDKRNRAAIGFDMYTNPVRAAAMAKARDNAAAAASGRVELVQEIEGQKQPGFLIYLPVYSSGAIPATVEERRAKLLGFAYSPIRAGDFLSSSFRAPPGVTLSVYHGNKPVTDSLLYRSDSGPVAARFTKTNTVDVVGQPWTFVFHSRISPYEALTLPLLMGVGGAILSWLLAVLVQRQGDARWEAQRALERERTARAEAERASIMKDEFLATVSHELRTPLGAIVGWAEVLRTGRVPDSEIPKAIEVVHRNAKAQAQLIDDLLDMNRILSGKMRLDLSPVELARAVEEAVASARPAAEAKGVALEPPIASTALVVRGDASRLQQIVWNLLANAIKFTPSGGRVQVALERDGKCARLTVSDTGEGIDAQHLERIFGRFEQVDASRTRKHGGLGIGLAIVRQLVELHGGEVSAHSEGVGKGATFVVELPLVILQTRAEPAAVSADTWQPSLAGVKVLLVEDDADTRELMRRVLSESGAEVHCASDALDGLDMLARVRPDVLLSDIGMPGMDGYALIRRVRSEGGTVPAAAITAYARAEDRAEAMRAGFQAHLVKPVRTEELVAVVRSLASGSDPGLGSDPSFTGV